MVRAGAHSGRLQFKRIGTTSSQLESVATTSSGKQIAEDRIDLFQQRAVGDLLPEAEHDSHGESGEHGGAGVADQRVLHPHGPRIPNQLLVFVSAGAGLTGWMDLFLASPARSDLYRGLVMTLK